MKKKYLKLTKDQLERGVIFSSQLQYGGSLHEVFATDKNPQEKIDRLKNDKFFNNSGFKYNEIRQ